MGKQAENRAQKALESPCAALYQASLKCERCVVAEHQLRSIQSSRLSCAVTHVSWRTITDILYVGLDDNKYDKQKCQEEFVAYKDCKKQEVSTLISKSNLFQILY